MKKTDLEKNKALKLIGKMKHSATPGRYGDTSGAAALDRREQRKLDQAQGLVSFPIKLKQPLIDDIRGRAATQGVSVNQVVGDLLEQALKQ